MTKDESPLELRRVSHSVGRRRRTMAPLPPVEAALPSLLLARLMLEHTFLTPTERRLGRGRRSALLLDRLAPAGEVSLVLAPPGWAGLVAAALRLLREPPGCRALLFAHEIQQLTERGEAEATSSPSTDPRIPIVVDKATSTRGALELAPWLRTKLARRHPLVVIVEQRRELDGSLWLLLLDPEREHTVLPPAGAVLRALATALARPGRRTRGGPDEAPATRHATWPHGVGAVSPQLVDLAWQDGAAREEFLSRVTRLVERDARRLVPSDAPTLDRLHGLGPAGEWARRLVADLQGFRAGLLPWSEIDRGAVLVGPPGTGKTSLVRAVAATAGVPLIAASLQQWQGARDGHLGTLLGAMQSSFTQARQAAPSVLLIDEIDGFTARSDLPTHHRDYGTQVVDGLLELLDGALSREGVIVLGTCNDARHLDPAILRPGRLERLLPVLPPDHAGLVALLRQAAAPLHFAPEDLDGLARAALQKGATGATVELFAREARRRARGERRELTVKDFQAAIGAPPPPWQEDDLQRVAVHELGHAVAAALLEPDLLGETRLARTPAELRGDGARGFVTWRLDEALSQPLVLTPTRLRRLLAIKLAGRAAEMLVLGEASAGAGGSEDSDLAVATAITTRALMMFGLGSPSGGQELVWLGQHGRRENNEAMRSNPALRQRVARELHDAQSLALDTLAPHRQALQRLAGRLRDRGHLCAQDVQQAVTPRGGEPE